MPKTDYFVLTSKDLDDLIQQVNIWIDSGHAPQGGIAAVPLPDGVQYLQAIVG